MPKDKNTKQNPAHKTKQQPTEAEESKPKDQEDKGHNLAIWYLIAIIVLLIAAGVGAYWWRDSQAKQAQQESQQKIEELEQEVKELKEAQAAKKETEPAAEESAGPTAADLENIQAAVESGDYAALESYMASQVTVILAASECCEGNTPAEAVANMAYADNGTAPWDWNVPEATIDGYRAGFYVDYFPEGVLVGKAANDFIISFSFNNDGDISTIFMAMNEDIL